MDDLLQDIAAEEERISRTLAALAQTASRPEMTVVELAAIATFIHNTYSGMENLLKRALRYVGVSLVPSGSSHKDLLDLVVEQRIISPDLSAELDAYRGFRHFFVHGYGVLLDADQLTPLAEHLPTVWGRFKAELLAFAQSQRHGRFHR